MGSLMMMLQGHDGRQRWKDEKGPSDSLSGEVTASVKLPLRDLPGEEPCHGEWWSPSTCGGVGQG